MRNFKVGDHCFAPIFCLCTSRTGKRVIIVEQISSSDLYRLELRDSCTCYTLNYKFYRTSDQLSPCSIILR